MKLAVIGAGWAGLAAAIHALRQGHDVHVYEAAAAAGGRARNIRNPALATATDNGQHILLGAYHASLGMMAQLGVDPQSAFYRYPLNLQSADQSLRLSFWPLPAPFHQLGVMFGSKGLQGWRGRLHLNRVLRSLDNPVIPADMNAALWLQQLGCPPRLQNVLWAPLCLAATNTALEHTDARLLAHLLAKSLGAHPGDSDLLIPRGHLHDLWPRQACEQLGDRLSRERITQLQAGPANTWYLNGKYHDRVIVATSAREARRLLSPLPGANLWLDTWPLPQMAAIGTLSLRLSRPWNSGHAMLLLQDNPARQAWGQWMFDASAYANTAEARSMAHIVIGRAQRYADTAPDTIFNGVLQQIRDQAKHLLPAVEQWSLITEKHATFDVVPGLKRPGTEPPWPGLYLAGDWTDTGFPAVLEGAVRSGLKAAQQATE
ncbi:hydroxysqualene dehydroxylase HpnE [Castellaniella sp.]|uniref:hydroxysqualene dehydroxylase HpnE n=1 Tax=Castellaniella sp. TaxID=1955812 RepID=UPI003A8D63AB